MKWRSEEDRTVVVRAVFVVDLFGEVLDEEGLFGGEAEDVVLGDPAVLAPDALGGQPQPGAGPGVAVVHNEAALLVLDLGVVGGDALVEEADVGFLSLADADGVVVLEDGPVGGLVVGLLELELDDALVEVLSRLPGTCLRMTTLISTS